MEFPLWLGAAEQGIEEACYTCGEDGPVKQDEGPHRAAESMEGREGVWKREVDEDEFVVECQK